jgi:choline dehydrogenase-like flavoprotein
MTTSPDELVVHGPYFAERVRRNQQRLGSELKAQYDFIVCGSGSSGSVVARRLARTPGCQRAAVPGNLKGDELERFVRDAVMTYWHQTGTTKMGQDAMSVVDGTLKVYGTEHLRIADGSIMPRVTTGNTMAPCVIIGERAAEILQAEHTL